MSHDPASVLDALGRIPKGWGASISFFADSYPCVSVTLARSKDEGDRMEYKTVDGHGADESLERAIAQAINEAVDKMEV